MLAYIFKLASNSKIKNNNGKLGFLKNNLSTAFSNAKTDVNHRW